MAIPLDPVLDEAAIQAAATDCLIAGRVLLALESCAIAALLILELVNLLLFSALLTALFVPLTLLFGGLIVLLGYLMGRSIGRVAMGRRYQRYLRTLSTARVSTVTELADVSGVSAEIIRRDLLSM